MGATSSANALITVNQFKKLYSGEGEHSDVANKYLPHADKCTKFWLSLCNLLIDSSKKIPASQVKKILEKTLVTFQPGYLGKTSYAVKFSDTDEDAGDVSSDIQALVEGALFLGSNKYEFGDDTQFFFENEQEARDVVEELIGKAVPTSEIVFSNWDSNRTISLLAFYGIGQQYLTNVRHPKGKELHDAVTEIDLSFLYNYKTRANYERYGCVAFFNAEKICLAIYWCLQEKLVHHTDEEWEHAKTVFKSSLITAITVKDHLVHVHWVASNSLLFATRQSFDPYHPVRRLLKPHSFGTASVNWLSKETLLPNTGLAARVFAFEKEDFTQALADCLTLCKFETFPQTVENKQLPGHFSHDLPFIRDGMKLWNAIHKYVTAYLSIWYPDDQAVHDDKDLEFFMAQYKLSPFWISYIPADYVMNKANLIDLCTHAIFYVTGMHEFVGAVSSYIFTPNSCGSKILPNKEEVDVDTFLLSQCLIAFTSLHKPMLINDWSHIHIHNKLTEQQKTELQAVLDSFQHDLNDLVNDIDRINQDRAFSFVAFNPRLLECSVSV